MALSISRRVRIHQGKIAVDGHVVLDETGSGIFAEFIRKAYKFAGISYPKFYKMDDLCKLALVAAEFALKDTGVIDKYGKENLGLIIQNGSSTYDTDVQYQSTIDDRGHYFPSPAVFVYTLPNIMLGEICIRHQIFGENALLIEPEFHPASLVKYVELLSGQGRVTTCLAGWIEQKEEHYDAFLCLVEKHEEEGPEEKRFNISNLEKTYHNQ